MMWSNREIATEALRRAAVIRERRKRGRELLITGTIDAPIRLLINGVEVDSSSYTAAEGSTVITLKEAYLKTLKNGTYTVTAEFEGGYAETALKVAVKATISNPASTGDNSNAWLWIALMGILGIAGIALIREKNFFGGKRRT